MHMLIVVRSVDTALEMKFHNVPCFRFGLYRVVQLNFTPAIEVFYRADGVDGLQEMERN